MEVANTKTRSAYRSGRVGRQVEDRRTTSGIVGGSVSHRRTTEGEQVDKQLVCLLQTKQDHTRQNKCKYGHGGFLIHMLKWTIKNQQSSSPNSHTHPRINTKISYLNTIFCLTGMHEMYSSQHMTADLTKHTFSATRLFATKLQN